MPTLTHPVSAQVRRWIAQAEAAGLVVEVEHADDGVIESVTVDIYRPRIAEPANMLDVVHNAERLHIYSLRTFATGRWSHTAMQHTYSLPSRKMKTRLVGYTIEGYTR